jgi:uncharacterized protein YdhG (YjbR/CyaY superfamily)
MDALKAKKTTATVTDYIGACPKKVQPSLRLMRATIRVAAPKATERTDYFEIPGYSYAGYDYDGMFAWFSYRAPYIRLHVRPPVIDDHKKNLTGYKLTKAIVSFPEEKPLPVSLIKKMVKASIVVMKKKGK